MFNVSDNELTSKSMMEFRAMALLNKYSTHILDKNDKAEFEELYRAFAGKYPEEIMVYGTYYEKNKRENQQGD